MTYGWADAILQPMMGVKYYEQAVAKNGPKTTDFFRLFMVPGMAHCGGGVGPDRNDAVTAVIDWVEKGKAPDSLIAQQGDQRPGGPHAPALPLPAGRALQGPGQHRRRRELQLRVPAEVVQTFRSAPPAGLKACTTCVPNHAREPCGVDIRMISLR